MLKSTLRVFMSQWSFSPVPFYALLLLCFGMYSPLQAQITDNFSDGELTSNPAWTGDISNFIVNAAGEMQLMAPAAGNSTLAVQGNISSNNTWEFYFRMEFAPSNLNVLRVYLLSDNAALTAGNGYYLEIGETGSTDALRLFKQSGGSATLLGSGTAGAVANDPALARVRVVRQGASWEVLADYAGGTAFITQITATDATIAGSTDRYMGVYCLYSETRKDKFFFDDFNSTPLPDLDPPTLVTGSFLDFNRVELVFSENLNATTAQTAGNYTVSGGIGAPQTAVLNATELNKVTLQFANSFVNGQNYTITVSGIADIANNAMPAPESINLPFLILEQPSANDILINEFLADETPSVGLPLAEFVELYNRSQKTIDLQNLTFRDGTGTPQALPSYILVPNAYVVVCDDSKSTLFASIINTISLANFPSLNNDGDQLYLEDLAGTRIDAIDYDLTWYTDGAKSEGGWSLQRTNPEILCKSGADNWHTSDASPGGTPGAQNEKYTNAPDSEAPELVQFTLLADDQLKIIFSENMDPTALSDPANYTFSPAAPAFTLLNTDQNRAVILHFATPITRGIVYAVTVSQNVSDCSGNAGAETQFDLILGEKPAYNDLVINELMFNPFPNEVRFVEIYNPGTKIYQLNEFVLDDLSETTNDRKSITAPGYIMPGEYITFSPDTAITAARYYIKNPAWFFENDLPSLVEDEGNITLIWQKNGETITVDSFNYNRSFHNALLNETEKEGISLERISASGATNNPDNWTSAAVVPGYGHGSPTAQNGQHVVVDSTSTDLLTLNPNRFSPNDDGREDFLSIQYQLPDAGYHATFSIYDTEGALIRKLVRQELIGTSGFVKWDGETDQNIKARTGIYILYAEIYKPDGSVKKEKKAFSVIGL